MHAMMSAMRCSAIMLNALIPPRDAFTSHLYHRRRANRRKMLCTTSRAMIRTTTTRRTSEEEEEEEEASRRRRRRREHKALAPIFSSSSSSSRWRSPSGIPRARREERAEQEQVKQEDLLATLVRTCFVDINRPPKEAEEVVEILRENWFDDIDALISSEDGTILVKPEEWTAMKLPMKLYNAVLARLAGSSGEKNKAKDDVEHSNATAKGREGDEDKAVPMKFTDIDGWIGGDLPLDARLPLQSRLYFEDNDKKKLSTEYRTNRRPGDVPLSEQRVTSRRRLPDYAISENNLPKTLEKELDKFVRDMTTRRVGQQGVPVRAQTVKNHRDVARAFCGYLINVKGLDENAENYSLKDAFPSSDSEGAQYAIEYMQWMVETRGILSSTEDAYVRSLIAVAKWLYPPLPKSSSASTSSASSRSNKNKNSLLSSTGEKINTDLVKELMRLQRGSRARARVAPRAADESKKWLDWPKYLVLVECLKLECAGFDKRGKPRNKADIARSIQLYLMFAVLACVPDRQRTLRELELNRTLFYDSSTKMWLIKHNAADYKTGNVYGTRPNLVLDPRIYPGLELWLNEYRQTFEPKHNFVFTRPNGQPYTASELSRAFSRCALRVTGQKVNPHLVRDMIITHVRGQGVASDNELEALAMYMGHSSAMQKGTYDRRTTSQKVAPAVSLMSLVNKSTNKKDV